MRLLAAPTESRIPSRQTPSRGCIVDAIHTEFSLIEWIRRQARGSTCVDTGIGDDAAVLRLPEGAQTLVTVDMLLEGTHFQMPPATGGEVGRKLLAVNLSDIAAMAGRPLAAFVSVGLPRDAHREFVEELHTGILELARRYDVALAGGDTNVWDGPLSVSLTLVGETTGRGAVTRNGAQVGDWVMVTGSFGGSLRGGHLAFEPRVAEAMALNEHFQLHSMIDVSDGLAADLHHVLDESRVGAVIRAENVPISEAAQQWVDERSALQHALGDGEDFELLFTLSPAEGARLLTAPPFTTPVARIGEIVAERTCLLRSVDGVLVALPRLGWEHGA